MGMELNRPDLKRVRADDGGEERVLGKLGREFGGKARGGGQLGAREAVRGIQGALQLTALKRRKVVVTRNDGGSSGGNGSDMSGVVGGGGDDEAASAITAVLLLSMRA